MIIYAMSQDAYALIGVVVGAGIVLLAGAINGRK